MKELVKQFQESISKISEEEFLKVWEELKEFNEIGPIAVEYVEQVLCKINNDQYNCILKPAKIIGVDKSEFNESDEFHLAA